MKSKAQKASAAPTAMRQFAQCNSHVHRLSMCCFLSKTDVFIVHILREFGIREARYANYCYAVVGDITIRFLSNLAQKSIVSYPELTYIFISYSLFLLF